MTPTVVVVEGAGFAATAATMIADLIRTAGKSGHGCTLALCGGTTPAPVYESLAKEAIDWPGVSIYFGDERVVPPDHPDSNYAMARRTLIDRVPIAAERVHRMEAERSDIHVAAREYDRQLPPRFDLLLLGLGADGHTASLFPDQPAVNELARRVLAVAAPQPPVEPAVARMTITPLVIAAARHVVVLVRGHDKAAMLQRVLEGPEDLNAMPAQSARAGTWIVDQDAATHLQSRDSDKCS